MTRPDNDRPALDEWWSQLADGSWAYFCAPRPPADDHPDPSGIDISGWPEVGASEDIPPALRAHPTGVVVTDSPIPPFPAGYEERP